MLASLKFIFSIVGIRFDSREPYLTTDAGEPLALVMEGRPGRTPPHEHFSHDGTPHQNPEVVQVWRKKRFLGIPVGIKRIELRYYPLTVAPGGRQADLNGINELIDNYNFAKDQDAYLAPMNEKVTRGALKVEDAGQVANGVPKLFLSKRRAFNLPDDDNYIEF